MIREATKNDLENFTADDPFASRIISLYLSYGLEYDFIRFFVQEEDGSVVSVISDFCSRSTLWLTEKSDKDEIKAFITFIGAKSVMYNASFDIDFDSAKEISGSVLEYLDDSEADSSGLIEPDAEAAYKLLKRCESESFIVPERLMFLSDVTHRKNNGKCAMLGTEDSGKLVSYAMTVSQADNAVIIGAVCTDPDYRNKGYSRRVVRALSSRYKRENKRVFVFSAEEKNTRFYERSGFVVTTQFTERFFENE